MITFESHGDFQNTLKFLHNVSSGNIYRVLDKYGEMGVSALRAATPVNTGLAATSWGYETEVNGSSATITWTNSDIENGGYPVAVMIQYGHGTGTGGYVQGIDYINPALRPIFDKLADEVWKAVTSS